MFKFLSPANSPLVGILIGDVSVIDIFAIVLSVSIKRRRNEQRIKLKLAVVHFTHQNPLQICACAWIYRWTKNYGKSGLDHRASGPPGRSGPRAAGRWAVVGRGPVFSKTLVNRLSRLDTVSSLCLF